MDDVAPATLDADRADGHAEGEVERQAGRRKLDTLSENHRGRGQVGGARDKGVAGVHRNDLEHLDGGIGSGVPRVGRVDLDAIEVGAVTGVGAALALTVVLNLNTSGRHLHAHGGNLVGRELVFRVAAVVAVGSGAITDVEAQVARVEPDTGDALTVAAAVAVSGEVDDVAPATDRSGRVDVELDGVVERQVDDRDRVTVDDDAGLREHGDDTIGVQRVAVAVDTLSGHLAAAVVLAGGAVEVASTTGDAARGRGERKDVDVVNNRPGRCVPRVGHPDACVLVNGAAVNTSSLALELVVVEHLDGEAADLEAHSGVLVLRQLVCRVATVVAVGAGAITDVEAQVARVEPDGRNAVAVAAAVAASGRDVDDVAPATLDADRADGHAEGEVERQAGRRKLDTLSENHRG